MEDDVTMALAPKDMQNKTDLDRKNNSTFILPEDEDFTNKARKRGYSDTQIAQALLKKKQIQSEGMRTDIVYGQDGTPQNIKKDSDGQQTIQKGNPFEGKSKQEVLRMAFESGITKKSALNDISDVYDLVMGTGKKTPEEIKQDDFAKANQFITDNPEAKSEDILLALRQYTNLDVTDINAIMSQAGIMSSKDVPALTEDNMRSIAVSLVKTNTSLFSDSKQGMEKAKSQIDMGKIKVNGKEVNLSKQQIGQIKAYMDEEYPDGRGLLQRLLPGGK